MSTSHLTESMPSRHSSLAPPARCSALGSPPKRGVTGVPVEKVAPHVERVGDEGLLELLCRLEYPGQLSRSVMWVVSYP
ncbi:hypothetical protein AB0D67_32565 [Streptosporangium sp. NPDC048047]|uniref:hypothetical protein n=1 Tax=Streptosporangium sp. NPDC048047 TaxID=3155748 RepID=UPI00341FEC42